MRAIALALLAIVAALAAVTVVIRRLREQVWVSPMLLDDVLDPDLQDLRRRLDRRADLSSARRRALARQIVDLAARRAGGEAPADQQPTLRALRRAIRDPGMEEGETREPGTPGRN